MAANGGAYREAMRNMDVLRVLGFAAFLMAVPCGTCGNAYLRALSCDWEQIIWLSALCCLALSLPGLGMRRLALADAMPTRDVMVRVAVVAALLSSVFEYVAHVFELGIWAIGLATFILGLASACLIFPWFEELLLVCRRFGTTRCIVVLIGCYLFVLTMGALIPYTPLATEPLASLGVVCLFFLVSGRLLLVLSHGVLGCCKGLGGTIGEGLGVLTSGYHLTPYSVAALISFGVTYSISCVVVLFATTLDPLTPWVAPAVSFVACCLGLLYFQKRSVGDMRFGFALRACAAATGIALAALPVLAAYVPALLRVVCTGTFIVQGITMIMFSITMCYEAKASIIGIVPINYAVFTISEVVTFVLCLAILRLCNESLAWNLLALLAVAVTLAIIPLLPSRSSGATAFSLDVLPEDESMENRIAKSREMFVARYGLSTREGEVLELILRGKSRQQIAEMLSLSSWTVRDHAGSIYSKTGVHSAKELMYLAGKEL